MSNETEYTDELYCEIMGATLEAPHYDTRKGTPINSLQDLKLEHRYCHLRQFLLNSYTLDVFVRPLKHDTTILIIVALFKEGLFLTRESTELPMPDTLEELNEIIRHLAGECLCDADAAKLRIIEKLMK